MRIESEPSRRRRDREGATTLVKRLAPFSVNIIIIIEPRHRRRRRSHPFLASFTRRVIALG